VHFDSRQKTRADTLCDLLRDRAAQLGGKTAYTFLEDGEEIGEAVSYAELASRVLSLAALLQKKFLPGDRILLLYPASIDYMVAFLACLCAGIIAVPVFPPRGGKRNHRLEAIARDCTPRAAMVSSKKLLHVDEAMAASPELAELELVCTDSITAAQAQWVEPRISSDTIAFLQYTSGSTGMPKGVMVSHGNVLHNEYMICASFESDALTTTVTWLPIYHDMGLIGQMLQSFWLGGHCVFMAPVAFLQRPIRWLRAISRFGGRVSGGPNFAYDLCVDRIAPADRQQLDLSSWKVAFNGAEPIRHGTLERFAAAFAPYGFSKRALHPCYGMAESTLIAAGGDAEELPTYKWVDKTQLTQRRIVETTPDVGQALVSSGFSVPHQTVRIVDPETRLLCQAGAVGEIWLAGPHIAHGYWQRPEINSEVFKAYIVGSNEGPFLRTGDLGFLDNDYLYITGRIKDVIIVRGANHYPQDIEATVEASDPALNPAGVAAFGLSDNGIERVLVVAEVGRSALRKLDSKSLIRRIRQQVLEQRDVTIDEVVLIRPGTLPKSSSGKVQRSRCRTLYLEDQLDRVPQDGRAAPAAVADA
jgi:acyl-CoA synthetase (AMP-forming)/AMP-acid ligase II